MMRMGLSVPVKKILCRFVAFVAAYCLIGEVFAAEFAVSGTDASRRYLGMIFGGQVGPIVLSSDSTMVIGMLFQRLNTVVFALGTIMIGYITVVSTMNTAKEGKAMGQKWSSIWIPIRSILGLLIMVPTPASGYSAIQVTVMWVVLQGVGAANYVWGAALDALMRGEAVATVNALSPDNAGSNLRITGPMKTRADNVVRSLFNAALCAHWVEQAIEVANETANGANGVVTFREYQNLPKPRLYPSSVLPGGVPDGISVGVPVAGQFQAICGSQKLLFDKTGSLENSQGRNGQPSWNQKRQYLMEGITSAYERMYQVTGVVFETLKRANDEGRGGNPAGPAGFDALYQDMAAGLIGQTGAFDEARADLLTAMKRMAYSTDTAGMQNTVAFARQIGWIHAGSYYMTLSTQAQQLLDPLDGQFIEGDSARLTFNSLVGVNAGTIKTAYPHLSTDNLVDAFVAGTNAISPQDKLYNFVTGTNNAPYNLMVQIVPATTNGNAAVGSIQSNAQQTPSSLQSSALGRALSRAGAGANRAADQGYEAGVGAAGAAAGAADEAGRYGGYWGEGVAYAGAGGAYAGAGLAQTLKAGGATLEGLSRFSNRITTRDPFTGTDLVAKFQSIIFDYADPLLGISVFGRDLMITAEYIVIIAYAIALGISFTAIMTCASPLAKVADTLVTGVLFPVMAAGVMLWSTGATFAVYIPMIPYLMFTVTAMGWMVAVIEAVVAAPILALAFVSPSGDELGKAASGLLILVDLFLKPTLMIFGFVLSARLLRAVLAMVNYMFEATLDATVSGVSPIFGWAVPLFLYCAFVVSLVNKAFTLIHIIPEKVGRWIGAQSSGFQVDDAMQKTEQKTGEGTAGAQGVLKGAGESATKKYSDNKGKIQEQDAAKANEASGSPPKK